MPKLSKKRRVNIQNGRKGAEKNKVRVYGEKKKLYINLSVLTIYKNDQIVKRDGASHLIDQLNGFFDIAFIAHVPHKQAKLTLEKIGINGPVFAQESMFKLDINLRESNTAHKINRRWGKPYLIYTVIPCFNEKKDFILDISPRFYTNPFIKNLVLMGVYRNDQKELCIHPKLFTALKSIAIGRSSHNFSLTECTRPFVETNVLRKPVESDEIIIENPPRVFTYNGHHSFESKLTRQRVCAIMETLPEIEMPAWFGNLKQKLIQNNDLLKTKITRLNKLISKKTDSAINAEYNKEEKHEEISILKARRDLLINDS